MHVRAACAGRAPIRGEAAPEFIDRFAEDGTDEQHNEMQADPPGHQVVYLAKELCDTKTA